MAVDAAGPHSGAQEGRQQLALAHINFHTEHDVHKRISNKRADLKLTFVLLKLNRRDFPGGAVVRNLPANAGDTGLSPGLGRPHMPRSN